MFIICLGDLRSKEGSTYGDWQLYSAHTWGGWGTDITALLPNITAPFELQTGWAVSIGRPGFVDILALRR